MCVLKTIRWILRLVGVLLIAAGLYLIFGAQQFIGTLLIIIAFLIIPNVSEKNKGADQHVTHQQVDVSRSASKENTSSEEGSNGDRDSANGDGH